MASGQSLEDILDMTWEQVALASESIHMHKFAMISEVVDPVLASLGVGYKSGSIKTPPKGKRKPRVKTQEEREAKDRELLRFISAAGFKVHDAGSG